jgi:hypothetical protein
MDELDRGTEEVVLKGNEESEKPTTKEKPEKNKGKLIMDATVANQMIT